MSVSCDSDCNILMLWTIKLLLPIFLLLYPKAPNRVTELELPNHPIWKGMKHKQLPQASQRTHNIQVHTRLSKSQRWGQNLTLKCSASNSVFLVNLQVPCGTQKSPSCLSILVKRVILSVENRWGIFRPSALPERWEAQMTAGPLHPSAAFSLRQACTASGSFCVSRFLSAARCSRWVISPGSRKYF